MDGQPRLFLKGADGDAIRAELSGHLLEEIARELGTSRNVVYKLAHDARRSLKRRLEAAGYTAADLAETWAAPSGGNVQ